MPAKSGTEILIGTMCRALGLDPQVIVAKIDEMGQIAKSAFARVETMERDIAAIKLHLQLGAHDHATEQAIQRTGADNDADPEDRTDIHRPRRLDG